MKKYLEGRSYQRKNENAASCSVLKNVIIDLTDQEILECSNLFSSAYGIYDSNSLMIKENSISGTVKHNRDAVIKTI